MAISTPGVVGSGRFGDFELVVEGFGVHHFGGLMYLRALNRLLSAGLIFAYIRLRSARSLVPGHRSLEIQLPMPSPDE
jgi:hypothetical protein